MRWATYVSDGGAEICGLVVEDEVRAVDATLLDVLRGEGLEAAAQRARDTPAEVRLLADTQLLAPVTRPPSIRDFMAFENHVVTSYRAMRKEVDPVWYEQPVFYFSNPAAVVGPGARVPVAPGSRMWDYELEVAVVVGTPGSDLDPDTAEGHIAGYTVYCDWSARDVQGVEMSVGLGPAKGKDTANGLGPFLVTPDELADARTATGYALRMSASVNGRTCSEGTWADLHWSFGQMLAYASRGTTLVPGDIIGSGTVGTGCILELGLTHGRDAYPWLQPGDEVTLSVERLGDLTATVALGPDIVPLR